MNFILQELQIDLGDTPIENIFITDYMPLADGTYVKVYLLGYKFAKDIQNNFNNETIAKDLKIPLIDVLNAWDYWEKEGIVKRHFEEDEYNYIVEFVNLKQLYIDNVYKYIKEPIHDINVKEYGNNFKTKKLKENTPNNFFEINNNSMNNFTHTYDSIKIGTKKNLLKKNVEDNNEIVSSKPAENVKMMKEIESMFGRPLSIKEKQKINEMTSAYNMSPYMISQAFSYCINNKKIKKIQYIESVVIKWHDAGVIDEDTMVEYLEKRNDRFYIYSKISKFLGFNRILTEAEIKNIDKWIDEWNFSEEVIMKSLDNSTKISNPNINYFDRILENWYKSGYKTIEDVLNGEKKRLGKKENKKIVDKTKVKDEKSKNKFHNFDQKIKNYSEEELEEIARKNLSDKLNKLGIDMAGENNE